jgi:hypothetical protein
MGGGLRGKKEGVSFLLALSFDSLSPRFFLSLSL